MKRKIIIFVVLLLIIIGGTIYIFSRNSTTKELENYLINNDFKKEDGLYAKQVSELNLDEYRDQSSYGNDSSYKIMYFDIDNYQLLETNIIYDDELEMIFSPVYDFKTKKLTYINEISINGINVIFKGNYDKIDDNFVCNVSSTEVDLSISDKSIICDKIKSDVEDFYVEARNLIKDRKLLKKISGS